MAVPPAAHGSMSRRLMPLALVFAAVGISVSFVGPYLALFLSDEIHAGPVQTTVFLLVAPLSGVVVAWLVGRLSDRRPIRRPLLIIAAVAGLAGAAATAFVRDYWLLLAVTVTLTALAGTLFPQSFAYARQVLEQGDPKRAAMGISALRTLFSVAWVAGPPLAALLLAERGFVYTYGLAALMYLVTALIVWRYLPEVGRPAERREDAAPAGPEAGRWTIFLLVAGVTVTQTAMTLGVQAMPLFAGEDLHGSVRDAGLILGLCAALEIPLMLGFGWLSTRVPLRRLILLGVAFGIAYQAIATAAGSVWVLAAAQLLNAAFIAAVSGLPISYMQDLMPAHPGRATTMIANTFPLGQIIAAPAFGLAQQFGFRLAYGINLALCVLGLLLILATRDRRNVPGVPQDALVPGRG
ncbi:sugar efflux transporter SetB [Paractinoplanes abujensis]|uniref:SET family sugar efflux transporter-like MFS transporter n=1 Tax=Paractinoplanes abujensis TaxID=882441 RepID=A0A7W7CZ47_9ACTN|nr:sugar efflux transporter [Actinoplanes abujensis]MBB4695988.1 SET family sugar efflux transporter-like MFS transporter [Actinoplanes abujensis]GID21975.1 sugar efflux transporter SetB [Actinoplanes abujensis]